MRPLTALATVMGSFALVSISFAGAPIPDSLDSRALAMAVQQLSSVDEARARMAELRLACAGVPALEALERAGVGRQPKLRPRLLRIFDVGLRASMTEADFHPHPALDAISRPRIEKARRLADSLAILRHLGKWGTPAHGVGESLNGDSRLAAEGGFAVPAAIRLLHDGQPMGRLVGVFMIQRLKARVARRELETVRMDEARITSWEGDYESTTTIGALATRALGDLERDWDYFGPIRCLIRDGPPGEVCYSLMTGIHEAEASIAGVPDDGSIGKGALDWNDWWARAWPVWSDWRDLSRGAEAPPDLEEWRTAVDSYAPYRFECDWDSSGTTTMEIVGSSMFRADLTAANWDRKTLTVLLSGSPPLSVRIPTSEARLRGWTLPEEAWQIGDGTTRLRIVGPDGRSREVEFDGLSGCHLRLTLREPRKPEERLRFR